MTSHEGDNHRDMLEILRHNLGVAFASAGENILAFASHPPVDEDGELTVSQYTLMLADAKSLRIQLQNMIDTVQERRANRSRNN